MIARYRVTVLFLMTCGVIELLLLLVRGWHL